MVAGSFVPWDAQIALRQIDYARPYWIVRPGNDPARQASIEPPLVARGDPDGSLALLRHHRAPKELNAGPCRADRVADHLAGTGQVIDIAAVRGCARRLCRVCTSR